MDFTKFGNNVLCFNTLQVKTFKTLFKPQHGLCITRVEEASSLLFVFLIPNNSTLEKKCRSANDTTLNLHLSMSAVDTWISPIFVFKTFTAEEATDPFKYKCNMSSRLICSISLVMYLFLLSLLDRSTEQENLAEALSRISIYRQDWLIFQHPADQQHAHSNSKGLVVYFSMFFF